MESKTLHQIKDEVAVKYGFENFESIINRIGRRNIIKICDEAAELYAKQIALAACEKQREICAEKATIQYHYLLSTVDKDSILNAPLAIK